MREDLLPLLACPTNRGDLVLRVDAWQGRHIETGELACPTCARQWCIDRGVPDFIGRPREDRVVPTTRGFARYWARDNSVIASEPAFNDELFRDWLRPIGPERFADRLVVEAG
ncbi:MAG: Trm112 family protein [Deltaproteobacteria bacterium]|nr:Trm112 family protein [Deltaproteobacteria bacterium]